MIVVQVGKLGQASLEGRRWSSSNEALRRWLQNETDALDIHGGMPDVDEFIVEQLGSELPLLIVDKREPPDDPEASSSAPEGTVVY